MKKINLKRISEILSEKEMKNVMGGSGEKCGDGSNISCYSVSCNDGDSYYVACPESIGYYCGPSGGSYSPC